ncbi:RNA polymerase sigma factor [Mesobacillus selenatarsenatis]|uniref:RNA polymerase sigma factor RpoE n=1 Tax=Mesobacillus selenatarsenatis (strain DSM 18680 / JCM 14380 / FERM P-15431 / SF-1) TaxID=1321606 RepID=A0A0A8X4S5_MESS1|nr:sigma-70 family RNA polymerase sigma factor [Mesobacillus selenatarsenatis]GAM14893.1 RNA polymerase sigma factor RpoE [Mesobacillus selenatarsenatis SF-1]
MSDPRIELYETYKNAIFLYLYRSTLNQHIAEDLTQDTFFKAFQSLSSFRGDSSLKTWLFKIARNTYINYSRKKQNKMEFQTDLIDMHWSQQPDHYKRSDDQHQIELTLLKLPENYRTYIILRDVNALSYEEVALITNESTGQVKVGLYRARKRFREIYREMEDGE